MVYNMIKSQNAYVWYGYKEDMLDDIILTIIKLEFMIRNLSKNDWRFLQISFNRGIYRIIYEEINSNNDILIILDPHFNVLKFNKYIEYNQ